MPDAPMTLAEFVLARTAEERTLALAAIDPKRPGRLWEWRYNYDDEPLDPNDEEPDALSLRTVEQYPTTSGVGPLPAFVIREAEVRQGAAQHIAHWDPARVLAQCDAHEALARRVQDASGTYRPGLREALVLVAAAWSGHPDYNPEWSGAHYPCQTEADPCPSCGGACLAEWGLPCYGEGLP